MCLDVSFALLLQLDDLGLHGLDLLAHLLVLGLLSLGVDGLALVEQLGLLEVQSVDTLGGSVVLFLAQVLAGLLLGLQLDHGTEGGSAGLQLGGLVQGSLSLGDSGLGSAVQGDLGIGQFLIVEDDGALVDVAVGIQHTGEGLGEDGLTGAGLADDGDGLALVEVQGNAADSGQGSAANLEVHVQVLNGQQYFSIFHTVPLSSCGFWDRMRRPGSGRRHTAPR